VVIIIKAQKLIIYYAVYDAIGRQRESIFYLSRRAYILSRTSLPVAQQCRLPFSADPLKLMLSFVSKWGLACRLCIIDAGIKIAFRRGTGSNYITSHGLMNSTKVQNPRRYSGAHSA